MLEALLSIAKISLTGFQIILNLKL